MSVGVRARNAREHVDGDIDGRRAETPERDAVGVTTDLQRRSVRELEARCDRRRLAATDPVSRPRSAAFATTCSGPLLIGTPQSTISASVPTRWRSACAVPATSPEPERVGVRLAHGRRAQDPDDVALGLQLDGGSVEVVAQDRAHGAADRAGEVGVLAGSDEREARRATAVHQEAVERERERLHSVVVGRERDRRLRLARSEHDLRPRSAEHRSAFQHRTRHLREDVERVPVAGMVKRAVAVRVDPLESPAGDALSAGAATRTGPPSTPMSCADTPIQMWPWRTISSSSVK